MESHLDMEKVVSAFVAAGWEEVKSEDSKFFKLKKGSSHSYFLKERPGSAT